MASSKGHNGPKLPVKQLAILAVVRFAEPLALTSVFPYLPEMMQSFGVEQDDVATWAGITGAVFSISQSVFAVPWGLASDRVGRKPAILTGLMAAMVCFIFWGMSTSLPMAIGVRAVMGGMSGNVGIIRTMVAELVPEKVLQPRAFSLMPLVWSIGSVFGPAFGGFFARPAEQFPGLFGDNKLLKQYPFLLPNLVAAVFFCISALTAILFLKETLESKRSQKDWGIRLGEKLTGTLQPRPRIRHPRRSFVDAEATAPLLASPSRLNSEISINTISEPKPRSIFTYQTTMALVCYTFLAFHSVAYDQVLPVYLNYPRQIPDEDNTKLPFKFSGGFGLTSDKIGTIFIVYGVACGLIQFLLFPPICTRFGVLTCYRFASLVFPFVYIATPYTGLIQDDHLRYAVFLGMLLVKGCAVILGFPCMTIMLTNSATSLKVLGTLNGFATAFSGVGRAVGPALTGLITTWGVQRGYIIAGWWFLAVVAAIGAIPPYFLEEGDGPYQTPDVADLPDEGVMEDDAAALLEETDDEDEDGDLIDLVQDGPVVAPESPKSKHSRNGSADLPPRMRLRRLSAAR